MKEAKSRGHEIKILDIGGGFPAPYNQHVKPFSALARKINAEIDRLFPQDIQILAEPGRFLVATAATSRRRASSARPCATARPATTSTTASITPSAGIIFDHCQYHLKAFKKGKTEICAVFGQTCDGLDTISQSEELPRPGDRRPGLCREHRRLQQRLRHLVQRLPAGQGGARERVRGWAPGV